MKWYQLDCGEVFRSLQTLEQGLSEAEVKERLEKYGPNKLPEEKGISRLKIILHQFNTS
jgi:Ca2+-transporting ATPase